MMPLPPDNKSNVLVHSAEGHYSEIVFTEDEIATYIYEGMKVCNSIEKWGGDQQAKKTARNMARTQMPEAIRKCYAHLHEGKENG